MKIGLLLMVLLHGGLLFAQTGHAEAPKLRHYKWRLTFLTKGLDIDPQKTVFSPIVRIVRHGVAEFETRNHEWVEFDFDPAEFGPGAFWIGGYVHTKEGEKCGFPSYGFDKHGILRWPRKQRLRIRLYSMEL